jgi:hypothetical protein
MVTVLYQNLIGIKSVHERLGKSELLQTSNLYVNRGDIESESYRHRLCLWAVVTWNLNHIKRHQIRLWAVIALDLNHIIDIESVYRDGNINPTRTSGRIDLYITDVLIRF